MPTLHTSDTVSFADSSEIQTHTVTAPTNLGNGDLWIIQILWRNNGRTITVPTGWTLAGQVLNTSSVLRGEVAVLWKIADGTETSVDIDFSFTTRAAWGSIRVTDFDSANPINNKSVFSSEDTNTGSVVLPSINSVNGNLLAIAGGMTGQGGARSITDSDGMTQEYDVADDGSAGVRSYGLSEDIIADGATGTRTISWSAGDEQLAIMYDINAVSSGVTISGITKADGVTLVPEGTAVAHMYADDNSGTNEVLLETKYTDINGDVTFDLELPVGKVRFIRSIYQENGRDIVTERFFTD